MKADVSRNDLYSRNFGLGASPEQAIASGRLGDVVQAACQCPMTAMPVIEYVTLTIPLPVTDTAVTATFGDQINVLNVQGTPPGVAQVDSSFAINGILQANMFVCGIGVHVFGEPISFTTIGNGMSTSLTSVPVSPDAFTANDLANGALGPTSGITPADFEWGICDWNAAWQMANAYQFQWTFCQRYLLINELLTDVCYYGPFAEGQGMSDSEVAVQQYIAQANAVYRGAAAGSVFMRPTHRRYGSVNVAGTGSGTLTGNTGVFHVASDWATAGVTYGGIKNQAHSGGYPYRRVAKPIFLGAGLPIKMQLSAQDQYHLTQFQRYISISEGANTNQTALVKMDSTLNGQPTFVAPQGLELTLDQGGNQFAANSAQTNRQLFKGGVLKLAMLLKGFEVGGQWVGCFQNPQTAQAMAQSVYIPGTSAGTSGVGLLAGGTR